MSEIKVGDIIFVNGYAKNCGHETFFFCDNNKFIVEIYKKDFCTLLVRPIDPLLEGDLFQVHRKQCRLLVKVRV